MQLANRMPIWALKKRAKALKKATGISHTEALESIARSEGFRDYFTLHQTYLNAGLPMEKPRVLKTEESIES